jgi:hypothetical protein
MGQLLMTLACSLGAVPVPSLDYVSMHYSPDFVRLLALLLGVADGGVFSWRHLIAVLGERILQEHDSLSIFNDHLVGKWGRGCGCVSRGKAKETLQTSKGLDYIVFSQDIVCPSCIVMVSLGAWIISHISEVSCSSPGR